MIYCLQYTYIHDDKKKVVSESSTQRQPTLVYCKPVCLQLLQYSSATVPGTVQWYPVPDSDCTFPLNFSNPSGRRWPIPSRSSLAARNHTPRAASCPGRADTGRHRRGPRRNRTGMSTCPTSSMSCSDPRALPGVPLGSARCVHW